MAPADDDISAEGMISLGKASERYKVFGKYELNCVTFWKRASIGHHFNRSSFHHRLWFSQPTAFLLMLWFPKGKPKSDMISWGNWKLKCVYFVEIACDSNINEGIKLGTCRFCTFVAPLCYFLKEKPVAGLFPKCEFQKVNARRNMLHWFRSVFVCA